MRAWARAIPPDTRTPPPFFITRQRASRRGGDETSRLTRVFAASVCRLAGLDATWHGSCSRAMLGAVPNEKTVEFFFSPGSRYCYLAGSQLPHIASRTGCRFDWRPVSGAEIRRLRGRDPFQGESVSGQYDWTYLEVLETRTSP